MLYIHSSTPIEKNIYKQLGLSNKEVSQIDLRYLEHEESFIWHLNQYPTKTILYTFFDYDMVDYLPSLQKKKQQIEWILHHAVKAGVENIIYVTHPAAYCDSVNVILQQEGVIQQRIASSKMNYNFLAIHALCDFEEQQHTLHKLYYSESIRKYVIPSSFKPVYALEMKDFMEVVGRLGNGCTNKAYEVFSAVYSLSDFISIYGGINAFIKCPNIAFQLFSYLVAKRSPGIVDMAWRPVIKMHRKKIEKDLGMNLVSKVYHPLQTKPYQIKSKVTSFPRLSLKEAPETLFI